MEIRERIIEEASQLFRMYGIKSVTMDTLASGLGISKRTLYEVFADKDELLVAVLVYMREMQKSLIEKIINESDNAIDAIFKMLEIGREHFQTMSPVFQADLRKFHVEVLMKKSDKCKMPDFNETVHIIERGIKEKLFREAINPEIVNRTFYSMGNLIMDNDIFPFEEFTKRDVIRNVFINYMRGIATPKGILEINRHDDKF